MAPQTQLMDVVLWWKTLTRTIKTNMKANLSTFCHTLNVMGFFWEALQRITPHPIKHFISTTSETRLFWDHLQHETVVRSTGTQDKQTAGSECPSKYTFSILKAHELWFQRTCRECYRNVSLIGTAFLRPVTVRSFHCVFWGCFCGSFMIFHTQALGCATGQVIQPVPSMINAIFSVL